MPSLLGHQWFIQMCLRLWSPPFAHILYRSALLLCHLVLSLSFKFQTTPGARLGFLLTALLRLNFEKGTTWRFEPLFTQYLACAKTTHLMIGLTRWALASTGIHVTRRKRSMRDRLLRSAEQTITFARCKQSGNFYRFLNKSLRLFSLVKSIWNKKFILLFENDFDWCWLRHFLCRKWKGFILFSFTTFYNSYVSTATQLFYHDLNVKL